MSKRTVNKAIDETIERARRRCEAATNKSYRYASDRWLRPAVGDRKLSKLKPKHLEQLYDEMLERGIATSTIKKVHTFIGMVCTEAERHGHLDRNPCRLAQLPKHVARLKKWPTTEEVHRFLEKAEERGDQCMFEFAWIISATGVRPGEAVTLMQQDVDDDLTLTIERALDVSTGAARVKCTKTGKVRRFTIDDVTGRIYRSRPDPYLFGGPEPERTDLMSKCFKRIAKRAKVDFTPRMLRHYHATQLIAAGVDIKTVADRLGHANPQTTWAFYVGSVPERQQVAAETIAKVMRRDDEGGK